MSSPSVTLQSVTGVDIELAIAGPGSRSYAFVVDWHIRLVLALAWFFVAMFVYNGGSFGLTASNSPTAVLSIWVPTLLLYFFYHPVLEIAMRGRTPGKRIAGVRVVTRQGDIPGAGALLLRNAFRLIDSLPLAYLLGLAIVIFTREHVRVGDLAAGTILVLDHESGASSFAGASVAGQGSLTPQALDLAHELLERWPVLEEAKRGSIARSLIARIEPRLSAAELAKLDDAGLRARLAELVKPAVA